MESFSTPEKAPIRTVLKEINANGIVNKSPSSAKQSTIGLQSHNNDLDATLSPEHDTTIDTSYAVNNLTCSDLISGLGGLKIDTPVGKKLKPNHNIDANASSDDDLFQECENDLDETPTAVQSTVDQTEVLGNNESFDFQPNIVNSTASVLNVTPNVSQVNDKSIALTPIVAESSVEDFLSEQESIGLNNAVHSTSVQSCNANRTIETGSIEKEENKTIALETAGSTNELNESVSAENLITTTEVKNIQPQIVFNSPGGSNFNITLGSVGENIVSNSTPDSNSDETIDLNSSGSSNRSSTNEKPLNQTVDFVTEGNPNETVELFNNKVAFPGTNLNGTIGLDKDVDSMPSSNLNATVELPVADSTTVDESSAAEEIVPVECPLNNTIELTPNIIETSSMVPCEKVAELNTSTDVRDSNIADETKTFNTTFEPPTLEVQPVNKMRNSENVTNDTFEAMHVDMNDTANFPPPPPEILSAANDQSIIGNESLFDQTIEMQDCSEPVNDLSEVPRPANMNVTINVIPLTTKVQSPKVASPFQALFRLKGNLLNQTQVLSEEPKNKVDLNKTVELQPKHELNKTVEFQPKHELNQTVELQPLELNKTVELQPKHELNKTVEFQPHELNQTVELQPKHELNQTVELQPHELNKTVELQPKHELNKTVELQPHELNNTVELQPKFESNLNQTIDLPIEPLHVNQTFVADKNSPINISQQTRKPDYSSWPVARRPINANAQLSKANMNETIVLDNNLPSVDVTFISTEPTSNTFQMPMQSDKPSADTKDETFKVPPLPSGKVSNPFGASSLTSQASFDISDDEFQSPGLILNSTDFDFLLSKGAPSSGQNNPRDSILERFDPISGRKSITYLPSLKLDATTTKLEPTIHEISIAESTTSVGNEPLLPIQDSDKIIDLNTSTTLDQSNSGDGDYSKASSTTETYEPDSIGDPLNTGVTMSAALIHDNINMDNNMKSMEPDMKEQPNLKVNDEPNVNKDMIEDVARKLKEAESREEAVLRRITEKEKALNKMTAVVENYEKTMVEMLSEREQSKQKYEKELAQARAERDSNLHHLTSLESTFSDLHVKYEKSKQMALEVRENESKLKELCDFSREQMKLQEQRYEKLKNHALTQLEGANAKLEAINKAHSNEIKKLTAQMKKDEISRQSIMDQLAQKTKENEELVKICDELINNGGS